jgi:type II secretory pathway component PulF
MQVSVGHKMRTADMTLADLENARAMVLARTRNAREAADRDRKDFIAFYKQLKPLLADGGTVGDALADLAAQAA